MKKILQILFGLFLILVLAYFSFLEVSSSIKSDLLDKVKTKFTDKGIVGINAEVDGEGLGLTRNIVLTGTTGSQNEKNRINAMIEGLEGVSSVHNEIVVEARAYTISSAVKVPVAKKVTSRVPVAKVAVSAVNIVEKAEKNVESNVTGLKAVVPLVPVAKEAVKAISSIEYSETNSTKVQVVVPSVPVAKVDTNVMVSNEISVSIPTVPVVTEKVVEVPKVVEVVTVPMPVEAEKAVLHEEVKNNIQMQGVE